MAGAAGIPRKDLQAVLQAAIPQRKLVRIPTASVLALFATPFPLVPAPGVSRFILLDEVLWEHRPATPPVAYAGIAAGEDLVVKYTNAAGQTASEVQETTGWLDQTVGALKVVKRRPEVAGTLGVYTENAALVAHILTGEIITGTGDIWAEVFYRILATRLPLER